MNPLVKGFTDALRPPDRRTPWEWCEEHVYVDDSSPLPGRWRSSNAPWVRKPMEDAANPAVHFISIKCSAQSAKTQTVLNLVCWITSESPGPSMWVMAAQDDAKDFLRDRALPTFDSCAPVRRQLRGVEKLTVLFNGMSLYFTGAGSKGKLQSKPIKNLFLDEVRNYPEGRLELALKRVRSHERRCKVFIISTPGNENDDVDAHFNAGSQHTWHVVCPECQIVQPLEFEQLRWDTNDTTKPNGRWKIDEVAKTIRYRCISCDHVWRDTPRDRRQLTREGRYVQLNPDAPESHRSYTWNALLPEWVSWKAIVKEYLDAVDAARSYPPDYEPMKGFVTETLGKAWSEALGIIDDFEFLEQRREDYDFGDVWPEEITRFMAADKQQKGGDHFFWAIRAFASGGKSRLVAYGRAETEEQLESIRVEYGVPLANAMMDSGYDATKVYRWCLKSGWKAFKGDQVDLYTASVIDPVTRKPKTIRRIWHKSLVDPSFGTKHDRVKGRGGITLYRFSSETTKDYLAEFMRGLVGQWTIPRKTGKDYLHQITAEARVEVVDTKGRVSYVWKELRKANHFFDCEQMILVAAVVSKIVQGGTARVPGTKVTS